MRFKWLTGLSIANLGLAKSLGLFLMNHIGEEVAEGLVFFVRFGEY